ncbi:MAG: NUDIX domain-containing protein [Spirochaetes bacterium]|nr:NUDIX domain-containing protein [Spirochaetota bacterium]
MEIWDILDETGALTGRTVERGRKIAPGDYHLVVHIWIIDESGNMLIQKRSPDLSWMPGIWAATGGAAIQGEDSITAALRETHEELGLCIAPEKFTLLTRQRRADDFSDIWIARGQRSEFSDIVMCPEVADTRWVTWGGLSAMIADGTFVRYDYFDILSHAVVSRGTAR